MEKCLIANLYDSHTFTVFCNLPIDDNFMISKMDDKKVRRSLHILLSHNLIKKTKSIYNIHPEFYLNIRKMLKNIQNNEKEDEHMYICFECSFEFSIIDSISQNNGLCIKCNSDNIDVKPSTNAITKDIEVLNSIIDKYCIKM